MTDELIVENDVMVPMRDGVRLRADVFRPATGGPYPRSSSATRTALAMAS